MVVHRKSAAPRSRKRKAVKSVKKRRTHGGRKRVLRKSRKTTTRIAAHFGGTSSVFSHRHKSSRMMKRLTDNLSPSHTFKDFLDSVVGIGNMNV